jgi:hypothetical protein
VIAARLRRRARSAPFRRDCDLSVTAFLQTVPYRRGRRRGSSISCVDRQRKNDVSIFQDYAALRGLTNEARPAHRRQACGPPQPHRPPAAHYLSLLSCSSW